MQFDEGELRGSVDGDEEVELALRGSNLGEVDMKLVSRHRGFDRLGMSLQVG
jgi:hypothetical protein